MKRFAYKLDELMEALNGGRIEDMVAEHQVSYESIRKMLYKLDARYVMAKWIPHRLSELNKEKRVATPQKNLRQLGKDPSLLNRIIAIDEFWLRSYTPLSDTQAHVWVLPGQTP